MGFLDGLKRTFNIAGVEIQVATEDDVCSQGDVITGRVIIRGTDRELSGDSIELTLEEFWTERQMTFAAGWVTTVTQSETRDQNRLVDAFTIERHSEQNLSVPCGLATQQPGLYPLDGLAAECQNGCPQSD